MSMIDPITGLPTPTSMLGGRPVLSAFPLPGLSTSAPILASTSVTSPISALGQQATNASNLLAESNALGSNAGRFLVPGGARTAASNVGKLLTGAPAANAGRLATAARFAGPVAAPIASNFLADRLGTGDTNRLQEAGRGFVRGAGWGVPAASALVASGIGAPGAPLVLAASAITGTIGAALDVLDAGKWFGGDDGDAAVDPDAVLTNIISTAELPPEVVDKILDSYSIQMQVAATIEDKQQRSAAEATALVQAANMALGFVEQRDQAKSAASNTLALQAQASDLFAPLANDIETSGLLYADAMRGIRDRLPESYRPIADATVARELSSSQRLANAYRAQAAVLPSVNQLAQYQQDFNSFAAQQFQQAQQAALQAAMGQGGGQAATDLTALLPTP